MNAGHFTIISPFMTIQWPGKRAEIGITARRRRGAERDRELVLRPDDVGVDEHVARAGNVVAGWRRRARR